MVNQKLLLQSAANRFTDIAARTMSQPYRIATVIIAVQISYATSRTQGGFPQTADKSLGNQGMIGHLP
jgi:hypothetical protein